MKKRTLFIIACLVLFTLSNVMIYVKSQNREEIESFETEKVNKTEIVLIGSK